MRRLPVAPALVIAYALLAGAVTTMAVAPLAQGMHRDACEIAGAAPCLDGLQWGSAFAQTAILGALGLGILWARSRPLGWTPRATARAQALAGLSMAPVAALLVVQLVRERAHVCEGPVCASWTSPFAVVLVVVALVAALAGLLVALDGAARLRHATAG